MRKEFREKIRIYFQPFSNGFELFQKNWFCFLKIAFLFFFPFLLIDNLLWSNSSFFESIPVKILGLYHLINSFIVSIIVLLFLIYLIAMIKAIRASDLGNPLGMRQAYKLAFGTLKDYIIVKLFYFMKICVWSLCFIIPGIIFGLFYSLCGMALLIDEKKGMEALIFSKDIVKPNFLKYLDYLFFILIFFFVICFPPITILDTAAVFFLSRGNFLMPRVIDYLQAMVIIIATIFMLIFFYYVYEKLKKDVINKA